MKKATLIIWAIITVIIAFFFYDNWEIFSQDISPNIRLVKDPIRPLPIFIYFILFFFFGFIIAYLFKFSTRFKAKRTNKKLNAEIATHESELTDLKKELDDLKGQTAAAADKAAGTKAGSDTIIELTKDSMVDQTGTSSVDKNEANPAKDLKDKSSKKKS